MNRGVAVNPKAANAVKKNMFKLGSVPYLNAKPLSWGLEGTTMEHPPALMRLLEDGRIDAGLLSSIEVLRRPDLWDYVRGVGVVSDGPVGSVRLYCSGPPAGIRTLGLDPHSLTGNLLARIILERRHGCRPRLGWRPARSWKEFDAAVVIGDDALRFPERGSLDLGSEWQALTGLPFVYAVWTYRKNHPRAAFLAERVRSCRDQGIRNLARIAAAESAKLKLDPAFCLRYLERCVRFRMGPREVKGMRRFGEWAACLE